MCDFCFMKSLVLHFTHLRSLFSLIDCWLILSRVISLTPLDLQNLSIPKIYLDQVLLNFLCSVLGGAGVSGPGPGYSELSGYSGPEAEYSGYLSFTIYTAGGRDEPFPWFFLLPPPLLFSTSLSLTP